MRISYGEKKVTMRQHHKVNHVFKAESSDAISVMFLELDYSHSKKNHLKVYQQTVENLALTSDPGALFHICNYIEANFPG